MPTRLTRLSSEAYLHSVTQIVLAMVNSPERSAAAIKVLNDHLTNVGLLVETKDATEKS